MRDQQPVARSSMVPFLGAVALALFALNFFSFLHRHFHHVRHIICQQEVETVRGAKAFTFEAHGLNELLTRDVEHDIRMAEYAVRKAQRLMERDMERAEREMRRAERELQSALREMEQRERRDRNRFRPFEIRTHDQECERPSHNHRHDARQRTILVHPNEGDHEETVRIRVIR